MRPFHFSFGTQMLSAEGKYGLSFVLAGLLLLMLFISANRWWRLLAGAWAALRRPPQRSAMPRPWPPSRAVHP